MVLCPWLQSLTPSLPPSADHILKISLPPTSWLPLIFSDYRETSFEGGGYNSGSGRNGFLENPFGYFFQMSRSLEKKKKTLWKVSYEECSLFETSTTQTPTLSRIESLAVHINTFQAQIKKCKQNKKIYIYIIFSPIQRFQVSMQQILLNTDSEEHTVQTVGTNRSLQRLRTAF